MFHEILQKFFLGCLQGLTEFLPISSSAHLILVPRYLRWTDPGLAFDVALHLGTLFAVVLYFWKDLAKLTAAFLLPWTPAGRDDRRLGGRLVLATIPGALAGLILESRVESLFRSPALIASALVAMGLALFVADHLGGGEKSLGDLSWRTALWVGTAQALALVPGISRSGVTITMGLLAGLRRKEAARFSFLLSIPIIAGAGVLKGRDIFLDPDRWGLAVGFLSAAATGFLAIWGLVRYVQTRRFTPFVVYRILLGTVIFLKLAQF